MQTAGERSKIRGRPCSAMFPVYEISCANFLLVPSYTLMESVASMDANDREAMSQAIGMNPLSCKLATSPGVNDRGCTG